MTRTKWIIEADQIILLPNRRAIFGAIPMIALIIGFGYYGRGELMAHTRSMISFSTISGFIMFLIVALSFNSVVFDMIDKKLLVKLFGFLIVRKVDFSDIATINPVTNTGGGYAYNVFRKSNRHGKGIRISAYYSKSDDKNAESLVNEVFPILERHLVNEATDDVNVPLTSFEHYKYEDGVYTVKGSKFFLTLVGSLLVLFGLYSLIIQQVQTNSFAAVYLPIGFGLFLLLAVSKEIKFDTNKRLITSSFIGGFRKSEYSFDGFIEFNIVRKTTNFVYSGTDVGIVMKEKNSDKLFAVNLISIRSTKKIERFMAETAKILGI